MNLQQLYYPVVKQSFKNSDANLYVPKNNDYTYMFLKTTIIMILGYEHCGDDTPSLLGNSSDFYSDDVLYISNASILLVENYKNKVGRKVQIIKIRTPADVLTTFDFGRFVVHSYDLTFLKNFFDGINLYSNFVGVVRKVGSDRLQYFSFSFKVEFSIFVLVIPKSIYINIKSSI
jgi:hypothetical protein